MAKCEACGEDHGEDEDGLIVAVFADTSQIEELGILTFEFRIGEFVRAHIGVMVNEDHKEVAKALQFLGDDRFSTLFRTAIDIHMAQMNEATEKAKKAGLN